MLKFILFFYTTDLYICIYANKTLITNNDSRPNYPKNAFQNMKL